MKFVGRQQELKILNRFFESNEAGLLILYGRRRVGKTRLVSYFAESKESERVFYWVATTHNEAYQLRDFSQAVLTYDPNWQTPIDEGYTFSSWEDALTHLAHVVKRDEAKHLIILDEFTYLLNNEPAISSVFQKVWDHQLAQIPQMKLILTGSLLGMMAREVFSYQAPLYGRATHQIRLRPLRYGAVYDLLPQHGADERVAIYGVTGGVPAYLNLFIDTDDFVTALRERCLVAGGMMLSDPAVILYEQLQEPQTYQSVLSAIATGHHKWGEIAKMAGLAETTLGRYLQLLQELELVERREPVLAKKNSKQGRYYVSDHFLRFYYRFIVPYIGLIERGYQDVVVQKMVVELRAFMGLHVFEELCRDWVWAKAIAGESDFVPEQVGSYWRRYRGQGVQLDVVAVAPREKRLLIGEAKWGKTLIGRRVLTDLMKRSQRMPQVAEGWQVDYVLFGRMGFTEALQLEADEVGCQLITLADIERQLSGDVA
ncbi:MAG TPA: ATP-binding protein [Anaerolineae bacterium]|nr:ATP-binding protein [Anaerolineae bacterium]